MKKTLIALAAFALSLPAYAGCPTGYVEVLKEVQGGTTYLTQNYCVSRYEMRQGGDGKPLSTSTGEPWHLSNTASQAACESVAAGYNLPSNDVWQTISRQAEGVASNWSGGITGRGQLSTDVTLPNGAVLYDTGDGVWEHVGSGTISANPNILGMHIEQVNPVTNTTYTTVGGSASRKPKEQFGPAYPSYNDTTYAARLGIVTTSYVGSTIMRGGDDSDPGLFGLALNHSANDGGGDVGFRCACSWYWCY